jgi:hypothetical protein
LTFAGRAMLSAILKTSISFTVNSFAMHRI